MYEQFTDRARKVMQLANQEAQRFNHEYIGTEHVLLGLVEEGSGVAASVLKNFGVDLRKIRLEVEKIVQSGPGMVTMGKLPQTPRAKKVIEYAMEEARNFNHNYVGTEHLLLGLIRDQEDVAAQILMNLGLKFEDMRSWLVNLSVIHPQADMVSPTALKFNRPQGLRPCWYRCSRMVEVSAIAKRWECFWRRGLFHAWGVNSQDAGGGSTAIVEDLETGDCSLRDGVTFGEPPQDEAKE